MRSTTDPKASSNDTENNKSINLFIAKMLLQATQELIQEQYELKKESDEQQEEGVNFEKALQNNKAIKHQQEIINAKAAVVQCSEEIKRLEASIAKQESNPPKETENNFITGLGKGLGYSAVGITGGAALGIGFSAAIIAIAGGSVVAACFAALHFIAFIAPIALVVTCIVVAVEHVLAAQNKYEENQVVHKNNLKQNKYSLGNKKERLISLQQKELSTLTAPLSVSSKTTPVMSSSASVSSLSVTLYNQGKDVAVYDKDAPAKAAAAATL